MEIAIIGAAVSVGTLMLGTYNALKEKTESANDLEICPTLEEVMQELCAARDDREHIYHAHHRTMERTNGYRIWVENVNNLEARTSRLIKQNDIRTKRPRIFRNPFSKLAKKMRMETKKALRLYKQVIDIMLVDRAPPRVVKMNAQKVEEYPTLQTSLDLILSHLTEARSKGVRVYGRLGVGKTAIMKNLNNHPNVAELFELVIWVNVSDDDNNNFSIRQMQEDIVKRLKINMEGRDNFADRIRDELTGKKYLLLLDGVNKDLNLEDIGIQPSEESDGKIVLTCREKHMCPLMVNRSVEIPRLKPHEAQEMFEKILGGPRNSQVMQQVIEYCCGLPYLIEKIASAFIHTESEEDWETGWRNLLYFSERGDTAIKKVYKHVEFFCNQLESPRSDCFLYSALYPGQSDINKKCLLDCWTAEDLCDRRDYARHILDELVRGTYLEESVCSSGEEYVRMEKYIWKVALDKLKADVQRRHLVKIGEDPPNAEDWNQKNRISLVDYDLDVLPECPDSSMLFTLFLQKNHRLRQIHTTFFRKMENLRVLNLQNTGIVSLPSSLLHLRNLKVLYINDCTNLLTLPFEIGKLGSLEVLDIRSTRISITQKSFFFPSIFGFLSKVPNPCRLKRFLVSFNTSGNQNDTQDVLRFCEVISNVSTTLEELVIDVNSYKMHCNNIINIVRGTVAPTMTNLTILKFLFQDGAEEVRKVVAGTTQNYFPHADDHLDSFLRKTRDLDSASFGVYISCSISPPLTPEISHYQKYVKVCNAQGRNGPTSSISGVLSRCDAFELVNDGVLEFLSQFGAASLNGVQGCLIESCNKIEAIADGNCITDNSPILPNLLELYMKKLPLLESIWKGPWKAGSLVRLETLLIDNCELLADLGISSNLPNLKKLILIDLPMLTTLGTDTAFLWTALEELEIKNCPSLTQLPFNMNTAMNLGCIKASQSWWDALIWQDPNVQQRLEHLYHAL